MPNIADTIGVIGGSIGSFLGNTLNPVIGGTQTTTTTTGADPNKKEKDNTTMIIVVVVMVIIVAVVLYMTLGKKAKVSPIPKPA